MQVISLKYTHTKTTLVAYERDFRFSTASGNVPAIWVHSPLRIKAEKKKSLRCTATRAFLHKFGIVKAVSAKIKGTLRNEKTKQNN